MVAVGVDKHFVLLGRRGHESKLEQGEPPAFPVDSTIYDTTVCFWNSLPERKKQFQSNRVSAVGFVVLRTSSASPAPRSLSLTSAPDPEHVR